MARTLRPSDRGSLVSQYQLALTRAGFSTVPDGIFGPATQDSVTAFQRSIGLPPDGILGQRTQSALRPFLRGYTFYRLKKGDTLWSIARAFGTTVQALETANPSLEPERLTVGQTITVPYGFSVVPTDIPWNSELYAFVTDGLVRRYPFLSLLTIGQSVMTAPLTVLRIGNGKKELFYSAAHHANEWITTPVLLKFLEEYAQSYATGGTIGGKNAGELFETATLFLAPLADPDGVDLVTGALSSGSYYQNAVRIAKDYPDIPFPNGWKANIAGTDLNLQYPAGWEQAKEIKYAQGFTSPAPRDFVGPAVLSAPESTAIARFTENHDFRLILAYHSQGEVIYWRFLDYEPENSRAIAEEFSRLSGYAVEDTPYASGFAGYKDWFIQQYNRPGYTIEVGKGISPLPLSQFDEIYQDNLGILISAVTLA